MHRQPEIDYHRVARGIGYIAAHYRTAPALDEIAAAAHLSPFHFQRMFTAWAGVSPKNFARYLSLDHARAALRDGGASLLDTALDAGLSGPGRLHDLFVKIEAMTPGEYARGGAGLAIRYGFADSLFGRLLVASTDRGICHMAFIDDADGPADDSKSVPEPLAESLAALRHTYPEAEITPADPCCHDDALAALSGDWSGVGPIRLHLRGTPFQIKVWEALLRIPAGALAGYGDVAAAIGRPTAARAVAGAIAANPVAVLIPCHRVIRQCGRLGGYAWGAARKQALIGREAAARDLATAG